MMQQIDTVIAYSALETYKAILLLRYFSSLWHNPKVALVIMCWTLSKECLHRDLTMCLVRLPRTPDAAAVVRYTESIVQCEAQV
jgi:hypothetical protein